MPDTHRIPRHAVDRPALRQRLDVGVEGPLTLLVAPAGSGKTVLLAQWVQSRPDLIAVWFDLSPADDDPARFTARLVQGLCGRHPALAALCEAPIDPAGGLGDATIDALVVAVEGVRGEVAMIFDDLHAPASSRVQKDLLHLAGRLPGNAHMILSSRIDPGVRWSSDRLEHALVELRQADLALDGRETAELLRRVAGADVDVETAAAVRRHTEGWAAGVQLAALSLRFHADGSQLAERLDESDRLAQDYLSEEVIDRQSPARRRAILELAVTDRVCAGLAHALTGIADTESLLRELVSESMFLRPVDGRGEWYRFHQLFHDILRYRLHAEDPEAERALHERAADWYLGNGDPDAAIEHLIHARSWPRALGLICARGEDVFEGGGTATVARWLEAVPRDVRRERGQAEVLYAIVLALSGRPAQGESLAHDLLTAGGLDVGSEIALRSYAAGFVLLRPHPELHLSEAMRALNLLEEHPDADIPRLLGLGRPARVRGHALASAGAACLLLGRLEEAHDWLRSAVDASPALTVIERVATVGGLALVEALRGSLLAATDLAQEAMELARETGVLAHGAMAEAFLANAIVELQRDDPVTAALALDEAISRAAEPERPPVEALCSLVAHLLDRDADVHQDAPPGSPPIVRDGWETHRLHRVRVQGSPSTTIPPQRSWSSLAFEEIASLLSRKLAAAARVRLAAFAFAPDRAGALARVEFELCRGWLAALEGRGAESDAHLAAALALAEPEHLVRPFLVAGAVVAGLVEDLPQASSSFRRSIVARAARSAAPRDEELEEPLTERERELLVYLPTRLTNLEIAARTFVSVNTVKTHVTHIYRKLGVQGRSEAVARARELGLIDPAAASTESEASAPGR